MLYWEAWEYEGTLIVHSGVVGDTGEVSYIPTSKAAQELVNRQAATLRSQGYAEIENEAHSVLLIQYPLDDIGSFEDLDKRHKVEKLMDECLGWTGLGHCDGGDIGSGDMNVCCFVINPSSAVAPILQCLKENDCLEGAALVLETPSGLNVLWPLEREKADLLHPVPDQQEVTASAQQCLQL